MKTTIGLVDDHQLFLKSLSLMLETFGAYEIIVEALHGKDLQEKMARSGKVPDMMLIDVNMPVMDGIETSRWLNQHYPAMKLIAVSMNDKDHAIIEMFKAGCSAYLLKDTHPTELERALKEVTGKGYYNADTSNINFRRILTKLNDKPEIALTIRERQFLKFACSELTYKQIAGEMNVSERTVDGYRESLFEKFHVQSRVGLCLEALRNGFASL